MKLHEILVSHRALHDALVPARTLEALAPNLDPAIQAIRVALARVGGGNVQAALLSELSEAVTVLGDAQRDPEILTAVENPMASRPTAFRFSVDNWHDAGLLVGIGRMKVAVSS